jgi:ParB-like nuclease domain
MNRIMPQNEVPTEDGLRIEYWPIERLIPSARNARTHSAAQVAEIAGSIRTFGFTNPLLVGEDADVVAGHGRLAAARLLGLSEVPVIPLRNLNETERRQLMLADNRIALNAGWDAKMLKLELADLGKLGADLKIIGFSEQELAAALGGAGAGFDPRGRGPRALRNRRIEAGRYLEARTASHRLRRFQGRKDCVGSARRRHTAIDGHRSPLWRRIRPGMAPPAGCQ